MRLTAVAATEPELAPTSGRALWDREKLYRSMVRWGCGSVVPIDGRRRGRAALGGACRLVSTAGSRWSAAWRGSTANRMLRDVAQVERVVCREGVEVLYGHIVFPSAPGLSTVWSTQGVLNARPGSWFPTQSGMTHARLIRRASAVQCWSELGRRGILEWAPSVDSSKVHVIPPLVYVDLPEPWAREGDDAVAIFIGAFGRLKGLDVALEAMGRVGAGVRLQVVTSDPRPDRLPSNVEWLGVRPNHEVLGRLRSADIHLFTSRTESFGGAAVEALAAGVPQVVDANGVPAEIAGDTAVHADGADPASVAAAIERLAGDSDLRAALSAKALDRYRADYSPDAVGPRFEALIDGA